MKKLVILVAMFTIATTALSTQAAVQKKKKKQPKKSVAALLADLEKQSPAQVATIRALAAYGAQAAPAVPKLLPLFKVKNEEIRLNAAIALGRIGKPAVSALTKELSSPDENVRFYAVWALGFIGPEAQVATPYLMKALKDKNSDVRRKAAYTLGRIAPAPSIDLVPRHEIIHVLIAALGDSNKDVREAAAQALPTFGKPAVGPLIKTLERLPSYREYAARALAKIGAAAKPAIPALKKMLMGEEEQLASQAANTLSKIGAASIPALMAAAKDDREKTRALAVGALQKIGVAAVPHMVDLLDAKHVDVRRRMADVLSSMQVRDKMVVLGLAYALKDKDEQVRRNSLTSLLRLGSSAKLAGPHVSKLLMHIDPAMRQMAFSTLQSLGVDPAPGLKKALTHKDARIRITTASLMALRNVEINLAVPVLLDGLANKELALRMQAAHALALRGQKADKVLPVLIAGLKNEIASVRRQAAEAISKYGRAARDAAPELIAALDDADARVRLLSLRALGNIGAESKLTIPVLAKLIGGADAKVRVAARNALFRTGPKGVPQLLELLRKAKHPEVRRAAIQTIGRLGRAAKDAAPDLVASLDDADAKVRLLSLTALGNIGADSKLTIPALVKLIGGTDANVRAAARNVLFRTGPKGIPQLLDLLKNAKHPEVRQAGIQTIAQLGPAAKNGVPELIRALGDKTAKVRWTAARALGNIGPDAKTAIPALQNAKNDQDANVKKIAAAALRQIRSGKNLGLFKVNGVLTSGDPLDRVRRGSYHVVHVYHMSAGSAYTIDLQAKWDTYLRLEDDRGRQLALDDDGGAGLNSRLVYRPQKNGFYRIIVTTYRARATGNYTLTVRKSGS